MIITQNILNVVSRESSNFDGKYKLTGDEFSIGIVEKINRDTIRTFNARLRTSPTCCGIAEFGMFHIQSYYPNPEDQTIFNEFIRLWKIIFNKAVHVEVVFAYLPENYKDPYLYYKHLIDELGFKPIYTFFNPNTRNNIVQYRWDKPNEPKKT